MVTNAGPQRHLVLIGMMGAGKSTIGQLAANNLGMDFNDIDDMIVRRERQSIPDIIGERGSRVSGCSSATWLPWSPIASRL